MMTPRRIIQRLPNTLHRFCLSLFLIPILNAQDVPQDYIIGRINLVRKAVFDTTGGRYHPDFVLLANRLHPLTRPGVITKELLVKPGMRYNHDLVEESERNLRRLPYLGDVHISRDTVDVRTIDLTVHTRDRWTLETGGSYKQEGGIQFASLTLQDYNFLGNGLRVMASYNRRTDRDNPDGYNLLINERRLFGSWWEVYWTYRQSEELTRQTIALMRRYSFEDASWSAGLQANSGQGEAYFYEDGNRARTFGYSQSTARLWLSHSYGDRLKIRTSLALARARTTSESLILSPAENYTFAILSFSPLWRIYNKEEFLNNFGRVEDVPRGILVNVLGAWNLRPRLPEAAQGYVRGDMIIAAKLAKTRYFSFGASWTAFLDSRFPAEQTLSWTARFYHKWSRRHLLALRLKGLYGENWTDYRQLILGGTSGLRGHPAYALTGQRLILANIEDRVFTPVNLWIYSIGLVAFADIGTTWTQNESFDMGMLSYSYGLGLRIENDVQPGSGIMRFDFAFTPGTRGLAEISISAGQLFSAFSRLVFISPVIGRF